MKIKDDKHYLNLWADIKQEGFTIEKVSRLDFSCKNDECIKAFEEIMEWLEENFIVYQYKNKTSVQYKNHELFFWSGGDLKYFRISFTNKHSFESWDIILNKILNHITENYNNIDGEIDLHYQNCIDWEMVNNYIENTEFDINNLPYNKIRAIVNYGGSKGCTVGDSLLSELSKNKLYELELELLKSLENKKVVYNGIKGTIKKIGNELYGFFKPKQRVTYYPIRFEKIKTLEVI